MAEGFRIATAYVDVHARGQGGVGREVRDAIRRDTAFNDAGGEAGSRFGSAFGDGAERGLVSRFRGFGMRLGGSLVSGLLGPLTSLGSLLASGMKLATLAAGIATVGAAAASSVGFLVAFVGALAPLAGLLAALPGALAMAVAGFVALKLVLPVLKEEMKAIQPVLDGIKKSAQDAFRAQLGDQIRQTAAVLQGPLSSGLSGVAGALGMVVARVAEFLRTAPAIDAIRSIFASLQASIERFAPAIAPLLQGFLDLAAVGAKWLSDLVPGIADAATRFGGFLSAASASGQALGWLNGALDLLRQLGAMAADVGGIISGVFRAAESAGVGALGIVGQLLDRLNAFVNSAAGQSMLVTIFQSLYQVGQSLMPVVRALGSALMTLAPVVVQIAAAFGPVLAGAIRALAPALAALGPGIIAIVGAFGSAVKVLAPALTPLAAAISGVLTAAAPLIPIAAQIATILAGVLVGALRVLAPAFVSLGQAIAPALSALGPGVMAVVQGVADGIRALTPALLPVAQAFSSILQALAPLLPLVGQLAALIATSLAAGLQAVMPSIQLLVSSFSQTAQILAPLIPLLINLAATVINALVPAFAPLLPQLASLIVQLVQGLLPAVTPLIPLIAQIAGQLGQFLVQALGLLIQALLPVLPVLSELAQTVGQALLKAFIDLAPSLLQVIQALLELLPALLPILPLIGQLIVALLPTWIAQIQVLSPVMVELIRAVLELVKAIMPLLPLLVDAAVKFAPVITQAILLTGALVQQLMPAFRWLVEVVTSAVKLVVDAFKWMYDQLIGHSIIPDLINGISRWISTLPKMFADWFGAAKDWAINKCTELLNWMTGLPGRILAAVGNLGGLLGGAGRDIMVGLWNGMAAQFDWFRTAIYNFFESIMPQWVKDALGIRSPSTLFADEVGRFIPEGVAKGILDHTGVVKSASQQMADTAFVSAAEVSPGDIAAAGTGASGGRSLHIGQLTLQLQGILDLRNPDAAARSFLLDLRDILRQLEGEYA